MRTFFFLVFSSSFFITYAQNTETIRVKAGDDIKSAISNNGIYRFQKFSNGTYQKKDGLTSNANFNYNLVTGEMQYLNSMGDTLAIANSNEINFVRMNDIKFYSKDGYKETVEDYDSIKLLKSIIIKIDFQKNGALGQPSDAPGIQETQTLLTSTNIYQLSLNQDAIVRKTTTYYLSYKDNVYTIANKSGFIKIFPSCKDAITNFLKDNKINFTKKEDLDKLLRFCLNSKVN